MRRAGTAIIAPALLAVPAAIPTADAAAPTEIAMPDDIEGKIVQVERGNIFIKGDTPRVEVRISSDHVSWRAYDFWGDPVGSCRHRSVPADGVATLKIPIATTGHFGLRVSTGRRCANVVARTTTAVLPKPARPVADGFSHTVQAHFSKGWSTKVIPLMQKAGVEAIRDAQVWKQIEQNDGSYEFDGKFQSYMDRLQAAGIKPYIGFGLSHPNHDEGCTPYEDDGRKAFAAFAKAVVNHFGRQIGYVQVYNEPNYKKTTDACDDQAAVGRHLELARAVDSALAEANHKVRVAAPELGMGTPELTKAKRWLREYVAGEGLQSLDGLSIHTYRPASNPRGPEPEGLGPQQIAPVRELLDSHGGEDIPIWITELGWQSGNVGVDDQAAYLPRAYVLARREGVSRISWYHFMDAKIPKKKNSFGLVHHEDNALGAYTPKPSYVAYGVMTSQLAGLTHRAKDDAPAGVQSHRFGGPGGPVRVMWAPNGKTVTLRTDDPVRVTNIMGETRTVEPTDGQVRLSLSGDVKYVHGAVDAVNAVNAG